jgi:hypothetical protein
MPRMPYAMKTLTDQIKDLREKAKFEAGDEDGFGVYRSVTFDKATTKWLGHAFDYIEDERIVGYRVSKDQLTVVFSDRSVEADQRDPFLIDEAQTVAASESA